MATRKALARARKVRRETRGKVAESRKHLEVPEAAKGGPGARKRKVQIRHASDSTWIMPVVKITKPGEKCGFAHAGPGRTRERVELSRFGRWNGPPERPRGA